MVKHEIVGISPGRKRTLSGFAPSLLQAIESEIAENIAKTQNNFRDIEFSVSVRDGRVRLMSTENSSGPWIEAKADNYLEQYTRNKTKTKPLSICQPDILTKRAKPVIAKFLESNLFLQDKTSTIILVIKHGEIAGIRTNSHSQFNRAVDVI